MNIHTKASQWDLPTAPVYPGSEAPPGGAPPGYTGSGVSGPEKGGLGSNNPYSHNNPGTSSSNVDEDARFAARLQEEENARSAGRPSSGGAQGDYYNQHGQYGQQPGMGSSSYDQNQLPPREDKKKGLGGLIGKLTGKSGGHHGQPGYGGQPQHGGYPQQGYPPQGGYGGYPPQGAYGGGYGHGGYGGGYGPPPRRQGGGGLGMGGAAALGVGGGLLGGALLAEGMDGGDEGDYGGGDDGGGGDFDGGGGDGGGGE